MQFHGLSSNPPRPSIEASVSADVARHVERTEPLRLCGHALVTLAALYLMKDVRPLAWPAAWLTLMVGHLGFSAWSGGRLRQEPIGPGNVQRRLRRITGVEGLFGLLWMAAAVMVFGIGSLPPRMALLVLIMMLSFGLTQSLSVHTAALLAFLVPPILGLGLAAFFGNGPFRLLAPALTTLWLAINLGQARQAHRTLLASMRNQYRADALAAELQVQKDRAEALNQSRSRLLAAASHDLRQPVHALSLFVGALGQRPAQDEAQRLLAHMRDTVDGMATMFSGLLDVAKLDAGMVQPELRTLVLQGLLQRIAVDVGALARAKGLVFRCDTAALGDAVVLTDALLLERVLRNLLSNAVRYTHQGEVRLAARIRRGAACLHVVDTGIGIPADQRDAIFEEFVQLNASPERDQGVGLGLAIVRRLGGLLGLRLGLRSQPGRGSLFTVRLPLESAAALPVPVQAPATIGAAEMLQAGDVVLVIDDAVEIRLAMSALFRGWGCRVLAAAGLAELTPQLLSLGVLPRLIVCDHRLQAGARGLAVIEQLRADFNHGVPAILVTGDTSPERLREAAASGLPLLHKPVTQATLLAAISAALAPLPPARPAPAPPQPGPLRLGAAPS